MKSWNPIIIIAFLLFFATDVTAQEQGSVVVHADPRLSVLMKKERVVMQASVARVANHNSVDKHIAAAPTHLVAEVIPPHPGAPAHVTPEAVHEPAVTPPPPAAAPEHTDIPAAKPKPVPPPFLREHEGPVIYSGKGYRVQIYNGSDRGKAIRVKAEFMHNNPGVHTYLTYVSPCFRVKVGNYRNRSDALGMYKEVKNIYTPCVIVPDIITINSH